MPRWLSLLLVLASLLALSPAVLAAPPTQEAVFENQEPVYTFGEQMVFNTKLQVEPPVVEAQLFVQSAGLADTIVLPLQLDPAGNATARLDLSRQPFRAFSELRYWYRAALPDGRIISSPEYSLRYTDNRFSWQHLEKEPFTVHWYSGDVPFAQEVMNIAQSGALSWRNYINIPLPKAVEIYIYDSIESMQPALQSSAQEWVAGHADPEMGVALVSLPAGPEQHLEMERQVPHELMHISLYSSLGPSYYNVPAWLNEGLASLAELYPNPDATSLLENAYRTGSLQPISALCHSFPAETDQALVAYAQSASFTRYIHREYGPGSLEEILAYLIQGEDCQTAIVSALGIPLERLEAEWRKNAFQGTIWPGEVTEMVPWVVVLALVLAGPLLMALGVIRRRPVEIEK